MNLKIGVCGIVCSKCNKYNNKKCPGCEPNKFCPLPECANNKKVKVCFECSEFPCAKHYSDGPFVKEILDYHKEK